MLPQSISPSLQLVRALIASLIAASSPSCADVHLGAQLQYDLGRFANAPAPLRDANAWRRARLSLTSEQFAGGEVKLQYDFAASRWSDAFYRRPVSSGQLMIGQFKPPFSADTLLSNSQSFFTENAASDLFAPGRRLGLQFSRSNFAAAAYGRDLHGNGPEAAFALRGFWPWGSENARWHVGAAGGMEHPASAPQRLRLRPEAGPDSGAWVSSPVFESRQTSRVGLELAHQRARWLVLGEAYQARYEDPGLRDQHARGGYLTSAWTLYGGPRAYRGGLFVEPTRIAGQIGSIELALRYAHADLPATAAELDHLGDGRQRSYSVGLNAQLGLHWRLQLNHHAVRRHQQPDGVTLWTARLQWVY